MPSISKIPLSYIGSDGTRQETSVTTGALRGYAIKPGMSVYGVTILERGNDVQHAGKLVFKVVCNTCENIMRLKATNLYNSNFACPDCTPHPQIRTPIRKADAPFNVGFLNYLVVTQRGRPEGPVYLGMYNVRCRCGASLQARWDKIEAGSFVGCGRCTDSMLYRSKYGLR